MRTRQYDPCQPRRRKLQFAPDIYRRLVRLRMQAHLEASMLLMQQPERATQLLSFFDEASRRAANDVARADWRVTLRD